VKWKWWQWLLGLLRIGLDRAHDAGAIPERKPGPDEDPGDRTFRG